MRSVYIIIIFIVALVVGYIAMGKVYIPYKTANFMSINLFCENGEIKMKENAVGFMANFGQMAFQMEASTKCVDYKTSRCTPSCKDGKPVCVCDATILDQLLNRRGEWLFG